MLVEIYCFHDDFCDCILLSWEHSAMDEIPVDEQRLNIRAIRAIIKHIHFL